MYIWSLWIGFTKASKKIKRNEQLSDSGISNKVASVFDFVYANEKHFIGAFQLIKNSLIYNAFA